MIICISFLIGITYQSYSQAILSPKARDTLRADCRMRLPETINSYQPTIAPVMTIDGKYVFLDRKIHPQNTGGIYDQDEIWLSERVGKNGWTEPERLNTRFNTKGNDLVFSISPDGSRVLIYNSEIKTDGTSRSAFTIAKLSGTNLVEGSLQKIDDYYNKSDNLHAHLSFDGKVLFLALERQEGYGDLDIYCLFYDSLKQSWTKPQNLGPKINTSGIEGCPFLAYDGKTLYFASTGRDGNGKYDLFFSRRLDNTWRNWTTPVNLGKAINTQYNENGFWLTALGDTAFIVSEDTGEREGIYQVCMPDFAKPLPYYLVALQISGLNGTSQEPLKDEAMVYVKGMKNTTSVSYRYDPATGFCYFPLPGGDKYNITVIDSNYNTQQFDEYATGLDHTSLLKRLTILTPKVLVSKTEAIRPVPSPEKLVINFAYDDYQLSIEESTRINEFLNSLKKLKYKQILIEGYTDSIGTEQYNLALSKIRAEEVKIFIIKAGIPKSKIITKWYGEAKPASIKPEEDRRVEINVK